MSQLSSYHQKVCPGQVGAFYFGDETNGHVFSYNFSLKDSRARGNQSRFSILILSWNKIYLLSSWSFLISNISRMVSRLRLSANKVFDDETLDNTANTTSNQSRTVTPLKRCATPPAALAPVLYGQAVAAGTAVAATGSGLFHHSTVGREARQKRATDSDMRSLADLTKDDQIFYRIHAWFTWLLRAGGRRWNIVPPVIAPPEDEDSLIAQEEHEALIAAGVEHLLSSCILSTSINTTNIGNTTRNITGQKLSQPKSSTLLLKASSSTVFSSNNTSESSEMLNTTKKMLDLSCISSEMENCVSVMILSRLFTLLGVNAFSRMVQHIAVGNQIVVQPLDEDINAALTLFALAKLLPKGCLRQVVGSAEYLAPFRCNLLSLSVHVSISKEDITISDDVLYLAVYRCCFCCPKPTGKSSATLNDEQDKQSDLQCYVNSLYFRLCSTLPSFDPEIISFKKTFFNQLSHHCTYPSTAGSHPSSAARHLLTGRIPVSSYVDQIIRLFSINPPFPIDVCDTALNTIRHDWINRARLLYSFKRCQGSSLSGDEATRRWAGVLASIGCSSPENAAVARFWQGALSQYSRNHVCHSRRRPTPNSTTTSRRGSFCSSNVDLNAVFAAAASSSCCNSCSTTPTAPVNE
ncbi:unnamed protein product [Heterobilharzia americana]|nr:unnamed protein product [Heterobilharzia americana]